MTGGAGLDNLNAIGEAPLHLACRMGKKEVVETLLKHDASPDLIGPNGDPREIAFVCNHQAIVDMLDERVTEMEQFDEMYGGKDLGDAGSRKSTIQPTVMRTQSKIQSHAYNKNRVSMRLQDASALMGLQYEEETRRGGSTSSSFSSSSPYKEGNGLPADEAQLNRPVVRKLSLDSRAMKKSQEQNAKGQCGPATSRNFDLEQIPPPLQGTKQLIPLSHTAKKRLIMTHPGFNQETGSFSEVGKSSQDLQLEYTQEHDDYYFISHFVTNPNKVFSEVN